MATKPSERRSYQDREMELNLTPMMNVIAILIPALLVSVAFVEIATLEVSSPSISEGSSEADSPGPVTLTISERGYRVTTEQTAGDPPEIPVVKRSVSCQRYLGTLPPPRSRNSAERPCTIRDGERSFWVYDLAGLKQALGALKTEHPGSRTILIAADPGVTYEAVTDAMDASRVQVSEDGGARPLFDQVLVSPRI